MVLKAVVVQKKVKVRKNINETVCVKKICKPSSRVIKRPRAFGIPNVFLCQTPFNCRFNRGMYHFVSLTQWELFVFRVSLSLKFSVDMS